MWPMTLLVPSECRANPVPFTRSGGRSLGGIERTVRTDLGFWSVDLVGIPVYSQAQRRTWLAIRQQLGGRAGLIAVPASSFDTAPYVSGEIEATPEVSFDDATTFDDGTLYEQPAITVVAHSLTPIGATIISLRAVDVAADLSGVRFSFNHALYETGPAIDVTDDVWTVPVFPSIRQLIPAGAELEFDNPSCLCHLADDRGMDGGLDMVGFERRSVSFVEATDYWNEQA